MSSEGGVQGRRWDGHAWSPWWLLDETFVAYSRDERQAPNKAGIYRVRCRGREGLIYIGQSGVTHGIRARLRQLRIAMRSAAPGGRPSPPHVAGACVRAHELRGCMVEVSWVALPDMPHRDRLGTECELIGAYRKAAGENPVCQFAGEMPVE